MINEDIPDKTIEFWVGLVVIDALVWLFHLNTPVPMAVSIGYSLAIFLLVMYHGDTWGNRWYEYGKERWLIALLVLLALPYYIFGGGIRAFIVAFENEGKSGVFSKWSITALFLFIMLIGVFRI